jgi:hypothetical protein
MGANIKEPHQMVMAIPPEMLHKELRVATTAATADLTPTSGKRIRLSNLMVRQTVPACVHGKPAHRNDRG